MCEMEESSIFMASLSVHMASVSRLRGSCTGWVQLENFHLSYNKEGSAEQLLLTHPEQQSALVPYCKESPGAGLTPMCFPAWV